MVSKVFGFDKTCMVAVDSDGVSPAQDTSPEEIKTKYKNFVPAGARFSKSISKKYCGWSFPSSRWPASYVEDLTRSINHVFDKDTTTSARPVTSAAPEKRAHDQRAVVRSRTRASARADDQTPAHSRDHADNDDEEEEEEYPDNAIAPVRHTRPLYPRGGRHTEGYRRPSPYYRDSRTGAVRYSRRSPRDDEPEKR